MRKAFVQSVLVLTLLFGREKGQLRRAAYHSDGDGERARNGPADLEEGGAWVDVHAQEARLLILRPGGGAEGEHQHQHPRRHRGGSNDRPPALHRQRSLGCPSAPPAPTERPSFSLSPASVVPCSASTRARDGEPLCAWDRLPPRPFPRAIERSRRCRFQVRKI